MTTRPSRDESTVTIIFVCTGNRARSPLAASLLRRHVAGLPVHVGSRGTLDLGPLPALSEMLEAGSRRGVDLSGHAATTLAPMELRETDLVLGFEPFHVAAAVIDGGARRERAFTLPEFLELARDLPLPRPTDIGAQIAAVADRAYARRGGSPLSAAEVRDPLGSRPEVFDQTATEIDRLVAELFRTIFPPGEATMRA